jgi:methylenetetrahydrofolate reductase (NADPH)
VVDLGHDVIVHVACRDRNRNGLQSLGWDLLSRGLSTVLAVTGDYPVEGYEGLSRPVFDVDSVGLLTLFRELGEAAAARAAADGAPDPETRSFFLGCAVSNVKRFERELLPQYLKLVLKARSGADYVISQVGYDARKQDELLRVLRREQVGIPAIANAYVLDRGVARAFHAGRVPGCVVTDELLALVERRAASPDKGRAFFLELAARQLVVARGIGYRGIYLSGHRDASEIGRILEFAEAFAEGDWRDLVAEVTFPLPGSFSLFERDPATGLNTDELSRPYRESLEPAARRRARRGVDAFYRVNRVAHARVFTPGTPGFRAWAGAYGRVERAHLGKPLHVLEQAVKVPLYDCRDCGDCSLPDVAYLCPESHCPKNQRNGPCGGSHDGRCEVGDRPCVWAEAYGRLKPYGEERALLDRPPVLQDNALRRTSAWANTFLGRDHFARAAVAPTTEKGRPS